MGEKQDFKTGEDLRSSSANLDGNVATCAASQSLNVSDEVVVSRYFSDESENELINSGYVSGDYGGVLDPEYENDYIDPNDPPYEEEAPIPKKLTDTLKRKRRFKKITVGLSKPQSADESQPEEFSLLSGLFGGETKKKRRKKPNTLKGPTSKDMPPEPRYVSDIRLEGTAMITSCHWCGEA